MSVDISLLDSSDDKELAAFHAVYEEADRHGRRFATPFALEEMAAALRTPSEYERRLPFVARINGAIVGVAILELPLRDNVSQVEADVFVLPAYQRRGIGTRLAHHVAAVAREHDRTVWNAWISGSDVDEPEGSLAPGEHLATRLGLTLGLRNVQRRLVLPVPPERLQQLLAEAAPHHLDYSFAAWVDHCPPEHVAAYCALKASMNTEAPTGDLDVEDQHWDEGRLREEEELLRASGRSRHVVVAVAPDATLAGHNELVVPRHDPGLVWQWDTLVLPAHRGHRLGLALKVLNLRDVQAAHPDRTEVCTFNAASNTHMVAVNDALGFVPVSYVGEWQGPVPA
jgi:GNAT superfamily N-acetyltransferase